MGQLFDDAFLALNDQGKAEAIKKHCYGKKLWVVFVDDEPETHAPLTDMVKSFGFECLATASIAEALKFVSLRVPEIALIISDYTMPEKNGFEFREDALRMAPDVPFIILSGQVNRDMALKGLELMIEAFLDKPVKEKALHQALAKYTEARVQQIHDELELIQGFTDDASTYTEQVEDLCLDL